MTVFLHEGDLPHGLDLGPEVAIDSETMGLRFRRDPLCVVQLSAGDGDAHVVRMSRPGYDCPNLKRLLTDLFAPGLNDRQRIAISERVTRAIYVHTHMDEESFDTDRVRLCPVGIREADGRNVPSCSYNVLYRDTDSRFAKHPGVMPGAGGRIW